MNTRYQFRLLMVCAGLLLATVAHADAVAALKVKLKSLEGSAPISGILSVRRTSTRGKDKPVTTRASLSLAVRDGPQGLELRFPAALMQKVQAERRAHAKQADAPEATLGLLASIDPTQVAEILSYAPVLLRHLEGAILLKQSMVKVQGKTQRLLEFKLPLKASKKGQDGLQDYRGRMNVWLNQDGVPVIVRQSRLIKVRKFFFIHINVDNSTTTNLSMWKGRLLQSQVTEQTRMTGIQNSDQTEHYRFRPEAVGAVTPAPAQSAGTSSSSVVPAAAATSSHLSPHKIKAALPHPA